MSKYKAFSNQSKSFDCNNSQNDNGLNKINVSFFDNVRSKKPTKKTLFESLTPTNEQIALIAKCRQILDKNERSRFKKKFIPAISIGGIYKNGHKGANLEKASNLVAIDFDSVEDLETLKSQLSNLPYIAYISLSVSGNGLFCIIPIDNHQKWNKDAYTRLIGEIEQNLSIACNPDKTCSDYERLRYISHDPKSYQNLQATTYVLDNSPIEKPLNTGSATPIKLDGTDSEWRRVMSAVYKTPWGIAGFIDGNKHNFLYTVARYANYMGIPENEYQSFIEQNYPAKYSSNFSSPYKAESERFGVWQNLSTKYLPTAKGQIDFTYPRFLTEGGEFVKRLPALLATSAKHLIGSPTGSGKSYSMFKEVVKYVKDNFVTDIKVMVCAPYKSMQNGWDVAEYAQKEGFLFCMEGRENARTVDISKQFFTSSFKQARTLHERLTDAGNNVIVIFDEMHELLKGQFQNFHSIGEILESKKTTVLGYSATNYNSYFQKRWGFNVLEAEPEKRNIPNVWVHITQGETGFENKLLELAEKEVKTGEFGHVMAFVHSKEMLERLHINAQKMGLKSGISHSDTEKMGGEESIDLESIKNTKKLSNQVLFSSSKNATGIDGRDFNVIASLNNVVRNDYALFTQMAARSRNAKTIHLVLQQPKKAQSKGGKKDFDFNELSRIENEFQEYCNAINFLESKRSIANHKYIKNYIGGFNTKAECKNEFTGLVYKKNSKWKVNALEIARRQIEEINLNYSNEDIVNIIRNDNAFNLVEVSNSSDQDETIEQERTREEVRFLRENTKEFATLEFTQDDDSKIFGIDLLCEYSYHQTRDSDFKQLIIRTNDHVAMVYANEVHCSKLLNERWEDIQGTMDFATIELLVSRFTRLMKATNNQATLPMLDYAMNVSSNKLFSEYIAKITRAFIRRIEAENCQTLDYALIQTRQEKRELFGYEFEKVVQEKYKTEGLTFSRVIEIYKQVRSKNGYDPIRLSNEKSKATQQITQYFSERFNYHLKESKLVVSTGSQLDIKEGDTPCFLTCGQTTKAQPVDKKNKLGEPVDNLENGLKPLKRRKSIKLITELSLVTCQSFGNEYANRIDKLLKPLIAHISREKMKEVDKQASGMSKNESKPINKPGTTGLDFSFIPKNSVNPDALEADLIKELEAIWHSKPINIAI